MDVSLKHLIGTVTLMSLILASGFSYTLITSYMEAQILRGQLYQIAEYVALNLVEVINLVKFSSQLSTGITYKVLKLPHDLGGRPYMIELLNETAQGKGCFIRAMLVMRRDIEASSIIPINNTIVIIEFKIEGNETLTSRGGIIYVSSIIYGGYEPGVYEPVVWGTATKAVKINENWVLTIKAGLGYMGGS